MEAITTLFYIVILILSVVIHELSHGYVANYLGDPTPRLQGRLTLNPWPHLDWLGSIIIPGILVLTGAGFIIGWAKPVQYNPYNIRNRRWGPAFIAVAGPLSNITLALIFGLIIRFVGGALPEAAMALMSGIVFINIILALFNLIPVPPLDGHHILFSALPAKYDHIKRTIQQYSFILIIIVILFVWQILFPVVQWVYTLITGMPVPML